jgi:hypothetical protein
MELKDSKNVKVKKIKQDSIAFLNLLKLFHPIKKLKLQKLKLRMQKIKVQKILEGKKNLLVEIQTLFF